MRRALIHLALLAALAAPAFGGEAEDDGLAELVGRLGHDSPRIRDEAARTLWSRGEAARPRLQTARDTHPDPEVRARAGRILFQIRWTLPPRLHRQLGAFWDDYESLPPRARLLRILDLKALDGALAVPLLTRAAEIDPHPRLRKRAGKVLAGFVLERLVREGEALLEAEKFVEAEAKFQKILRLDDKNAEALYQLARSRLLRGDETKALEFLRRAAASGRETYVLARMNEEGCRFLEKKAFDEAERRFRLMLEVDPLHVLALYNLACSRSLQGDVEGALRCFEGAVDNGYDDFEHALEDPDLENLRKDPRFRRLLRGRWR